MNSNAAISFQNEIDDTLKKKKTLALGELSRILYSSVIALNTAEFKFDDYFELLEKLRPHINHLLSDLRKKYIGSSFPLSAKQNKIAKFVNKIQTEMFTGYKQVILQTNQMSSLNGFLHRKITLNATYSAVNYLNQILLNSYCIYSKPPTGIWLELHHLYYFSESANILTKKVIFDDIKNDSIITLYKQMLLFSLISPHQLRQSYMEKIYTELKKWASYCKLNSVDKSKGSNNDPIVIYKNLDNKPQNTALNNIEDKELLLYFEFSKLIKELNKALKKIGDNADFLQGDSNNLDIHSATVKCLMNTWNIVRQRKASRQVKDEQVKVIFGLSSIHHYIEIQGMKELLSEDINELNDDNKEQENNLSLVEMGEMSEITPHHAYSLKEDQNEHIEIRTPMWSDKKSGKNSMLNQHVFHLRDESDTGMQLSYSRTDNDSCDLQIGKLIGIETHLDEKILPVYYVGVICWMQEKNKSEIDVGVKFLAKAPKAVDIITYREGIKRGDPTEGVILTNNNLADQKATIIVPSLVKRFDLGITIVETEDTYNILLENELESNDSFSMFDFQIVKEENDAEQSETEAKKESDNQQSEQSQQKPGAKDDDDIDDVWDAL